MPENKDKKIGVEIRGPSVLHGKRARLTRNEQEVIGVLLANDSQVNSDSFTFQYTDLNGAKCISHVTSDELHNIDEYLIDY